MKVGDKVRHEEYGIGIIKEDDYSNTPYKILLNNDSIHWCKECELTSIETLEFKVGDKVRLIRNTENTSCNDVRKGEIGCIISTNNESKISNIYMIQSSDGRKTKINIDGIELVTDTTTEIKKGDRVRLTGRMSKINMLLSQMKENVWYREKDFILDKMSLAEKYLFYTSGHRALSSLLYYGVRKGYIERRKRTKRNWEYTISKKGEAKWKN